MLYFTTFLNRFISFLFAVFVHVSFIYNRVPVSTNCDQFFQCIHFVLWQTVFFGHVLRNEDGHVLRRALDFEVEGQGRKGRPNKTWRMQVEEESVKVGLRREDTVCRSKWSVGVLQIAVGLR